MDVGSEFAGVSILLRIHPGHQAGARRKTLRGVVKLGKAQAAFRQPVQVRGVNFAPVAPDVRPAHIIDKDKNDVGIRYGETTACNHGDKCVEKKFLQVAHAVLKSNFEGSVLEIRRCEKTGDRDQ